MKHCLSLISLFILSSLSSNVWAQTCVDFESLVLWTEYGNQAGNQPGDIIFIENGIPVSVEDFYPNAIDTVFGNCQVVDTSYVGFGNGNVMFTIAINLKFDYSGLPFTTNLVILELKDFGGFPTPAGNISINDEPAFIGEFINYAPPPGFTFDISYVMNRGTITIRGPVNTLLFGGVELAMDDICAEDSTLSSIGNNISNSSSKNFLLSQNYPNPFNPSTIIKYSIPQISNVVLKVFDILGNEIETLVNEEKQSGTYEVTWYAEGLPSGVYFYRLQAGDFVESKKMVLMK